MKQRQLIKPSKNISGGNWSRRTFLRTAALATGGTSVGFPILLRAGDTNKKTNVAHIGFGGMGKGRLREMLGCRANIIALCDVDENQFPAAREIVEKAAFKPREYVDFREMLEKEKDLDAVVITTPDHWHAPITTAALAAGKHVFCEKPLTHTISEARAVRELVRKCPNQVTQMGNQGSASPAPISLPRVHNHVAEWVEACAGGPPTFSNFEIGGHLTEIALSGVLALRTQKSLDWNGAQMRAKNAPEAEEYIQSKYRSDWRI